MATITKYVWDLVNDCVLSELDGTNATTAIYTNEARQYGGVLSQRRGSTSHFHHHDALGSIRFLTDGSGTITDTYLYDAWGNSVASTGTTVNPFRWVGKWGYQTDASTGQVYVRARIYQPTIARWCSADPIGFAEAIHRYVYVRQSPIKNTDPSGLFSRDWRDKWRPNCWCVYAECPDCEQVIGPVSYGCHCGPVGTNNPQGRPIDTVDAGCQEHDGCWGAVVPPCEQPDVKIIWRPPVPDRRNACRLCDATFCEKLIASDCSEYSDPVELDNCHAYRCNALYLFQCRDFLLPSPGPGAELPDCPGRMWPFAPNGDPTCEKYERKWPPTGV